MKNVNNQFKILAEFYALCEKASAAEDTNFDDFHEKEYSSVLDYLILHPERRKILGDALLDMARFPGKISAELVEYCMYELRWEEVKQKAEKLLRDADDYRAKAVYAHILESFRDDWDTEGYDRWESKGN